VPADESGNSKCFLTVLIRDRTVTIRGGHPISRNMMDLAKRPLSRPHLQGWSIPPISYRSRSRADRSHTRRLPLPRRFRAWKFSRHSMPKSKCTGCPNKAYVHIVTPDNGWYRRFRHRISGSFAWQGSPLARGCPDSLCIALGRSIDRAGSGCDRAAMEGDAVNRATMTEVFTGRVVSNTGAVRELALWSFFEDVLMDHGVTGWRGHGVEDISSSAFARG